MKNQELLNEYLDYFPIPLDESKLIELTGDGKKPKGKWEEHSPDWIPFIHPTAIRTNFYEHLGYYLCVLDWDYPSKTSNPIWKDFEYTETLVRETQHGLHAFYLSSVPREYKEIKNLNGGLAIDFRMISSANPGSEGNYVKYHPQYVDNGLEALIIDINEVIASLYEQNNVRLEKQGSYSVNPKPTSDDYVFNDYTEALAQYFYYKESAKNPLWEDGYHIAWDLGLKLGGYIRTSEEARGFAIRLMELATVYDSPTQFIDNFVNGWSNSDNICKDNFGGNKLTKLAINFFLKKNLSIVEYAKIMSKYSFESYLTVIKNLRRNK